VLLRLAYLGVTNALALLRLLPMSNSAKDTEILALRHQITVLERHLHGEKIRFAPTDRAFLAALLHKLPRDVLHRIRLLVRPETVLRWHRDLITRRHAAISRQREKERQRRRRPPATPAGGTNPAASTDGGEPAQTPAGQPSRTGSRPGSRPWSRR
jgi:hypothetical protein